MTTIQDSTMNTLSVDNSKPTSEIKVPIPMVCKAPVHTGPRHKLITEADVQVCRLNHTRTIVSKIMNSRYLRRWESHKIILDHNEMRSSTRMRKMEEALFNYQDNSREVLSSSFNSS